VAITFDDGPDALVTPQVLDLLDRYDAKASFFVVGQQTPECIRTLPETSRRREHSLENHSSTHAVLFSFFGFSGLQREIEAVQLGVATVSGTNAAILFVPRPDFIHRFDPSAHAPRPSPGHLDTARLRRPRPQSAACTESPHSQSFGRRHLAAARRERGSRLGRRDRLCCKFCPPLLRELQARGLRAVTSGRTPCGCRLHPRMAGAMIDAVLLREAAANLYRDCGCVPFHFAKGKLKQDPVVTDLLVAELPVLHGFISREAVGSGMRSGLLFAALDASAAAGAKTRSRTPCLPPVPPIAHARGFDALPANVRWASRSGQ